MFFCAAIIYKSSVMGVSGIFPDVQYFPFQLIIVLVLGSATFFFLALDLFFKVSSKLIVAIPMSHINTSSTEMMMFWSSFSDYLYLFLSKGGVVCTSF